MKVKWGRVRLPRRDSLAFGEPGCRGRGRAFGRSTSHQINVAGMAMALTMPKRGWREGG
jgi:hypothetical protein